MDGSTAALAVAGAADSRHDEYVGGSTAVYPPQTPAGAVSFRSVLDEGRPVGPGEAGNLFAPPPDGAPRDVAFVGDRHVPTHSGTRSAAGALASVAGGRQPTFRRRRYGATCHSTPSRWRTTWPS
jgi:hypothetical protein